MGEFEMKEVTDKIFWSFDGIKFLNAEKCLKHENSIRASGLLERVSGLTVDHVSSALTREDVELADALEKIGAIIAKVRRASGAMRRVRPSKAAPAGSVEAGEGDENKQVEERPRPDDELSTQEIDRLVGQVGDQVGDQAGEVGQAA